MKKTACFFLFFVSLLFYQDYLVQEAGATVRIMPLGDSITMGNNSGADPDNNAVYVSYRKALWDKLIGKGLDVDFVGSLNSGAQVFGSVGPADHEGHPGWSSDQLLSGRTDQPAAGKLLDWLLNHQPDVILLHIGTNALQTSAEDVEAILDEIDYYSEDVWVVLARIINRNCSTSNPACPESGTTTIFNSNVEAMAQSRIANLKDKIVIVDMETGAGLDYDLKPAGDMFDNLHPFETGYSKMAELWFAALDDILPVPGTNVTLERIEILGPASVKETAGGDYICRAFYNDGTPDGTTNRLVRATSWNENSTYAAISNLGNLTTEEVPSDQAITVQASYTEGGITADATYSVAIKDTVVTSLSSGGSQDGSVAQDGWVYYRIDASASDSLVMVELFNLSGDVDLYVQAGSRPTLTSYYCRPKLGGTASEICTLTNSGATTWFIGVFGYRAGNFAVKATVGSGGGEPVTLGAGYSVDVKNDGSKYYHDGNDWVGRSSTGVLRTVNLWDIASIDPAWDITAVEVRFFAESKAGSTGALSVVRYGSSHGEDDPRVDSGAVAYSKSSGSQYATLPEPYSGAWTGWVNLGNVAATDLEWCRDNGRTIWSVALKASATVEGSKTVRHVDFSEDNEATNAEIRITYTQTGPSNNPPTAQIVSIAPNPVNAGDTATFIGNGEDSDGSVVAYGWTSSTDGDLSSSKEFTTSSLSPGIHTISLRVQDNVGAWSSAVTASLTVTSSGGEPVTLGAGYSVDVKNDGSKYYHDGNDWVGRSSTGVLRAVNLWDISSIDSAWDITAVEVRFFAESKAGSTGALSVVRYGSSHGEDDPRSDSGAVAYSKSAGSQYATLPEPSSGAWTGWVNLGDVAAADLEWCRDNGRTIWSVGLKASATVETSTTVRHVDFSEDNEATNAELRITYTPTGPSNNNPPTAQIVSIAPNPVNAGELVAFTGHGEDSDGSVVAYSWTSSIDGGLGISSSTFSTSSLSAGTHTVSLRVQDNDEAWSSAVTASLTVTSLAVETTEHLYVCLGYRWPAVVNIKADIETLLQSMGAYKDGTEWRYRNQNLNKIFTISFVEDINSMKLALQTEGSHVLFLGHSNYGLGPVFATSNEIRYQRISNIRYIDDLRIFNLSSKWISVNINEIQTDHTFPNWLPIFQDGTSGIMPFDFNDPRGDPPYNYYLSYKIPGDPNLYKVESAEFGAIERFPDSGKPAWFSADGREPDPQNPEEAAYYIVNQDPAATTHFRRKTIVFRKELEIPKESLKYSRLFYDSCNSGNYFLDTFNRGVVFYTLKNSDGLGFNAYIKAYLEGKSNNEIWSIIQSYDPVYDYYDFNKIPSEQ